MSQPAANRRRTAAIVTAALAFAGFAVSVPSAAEAGNGKIGPVANLSASATKPGAQYVVHASWSALSGSTSYAVQVSDASGVKLASGKVTGLSYDAVTNLKVGAKAVVKVTPYAGKRAGRPATTSLVMPDVTAPVGSYVLLAHGADPHVTVQRNSLVDDLTPLSSIKQTIDWGDGSSQTWNTGTTTISHTYPDGLKLYYPVVTVADQAHNSANYYLTVAVADSAAPSGSYSLAATTAFARYTPVRLIDNGAADNLSSPENIQRTINWGDGTALEVWPIGATPTHRYASGGSFSPTVTLTDQALNEQPPVAAGTVQVTVDSTAPTTSIRKPARRAAVRSWRQVHGTANDGAGVGVAYVKVRLIEKRAGHWYAYKPAKRSWVKAATKSGAWKRAGIARATSNAAHDWAIRVRGLRTGVLVVRAAGVDNVGNTSAWVQRKQLLRR